MMEYRYTERTSNDRRDSDGIGGRRPPKAVMGCPGCQVDISQGKRYEGYTPSTGVHVVRRTTYYDVIPCEEHQVLVAETADFCYNDLPQPAWL